MKLLADGIKSKNILSEKFRKSQNLFRDSDFAGRLTKKGVLCNG